MISTGTPFVLRFSKDERRVFQQKQDHSNLLSQAFLAPYHLVFCLKGGAMEKSLRSGTDLAISYKSSRLRRAMQPSIRGPPEVGVG
jgi:hypothetical protein